MAHTPDDYRTLAGKIFIDLTTASSPNSIYVNGNYWQVGCVYDTLIDYMAYAVTQGTMTRKAAQDVNHSIVVFYDTMSGCWYDDYCWWVITLMKSFTHAPLFYPDDIARCKQIIFDAWTIVDKGKPGLSYSGGAARAFAVCDQTVYTPVKPLYDGGTWQYDIYTSRTPNGSCDPTHNNPITVDGLTPPELGPYQLAVINGLYMVMTQRMSNLKIIPSKDADGQFKFIKQWTSTAQSADYNLLNTFDSDGQYGLIRERVSRYLDASVPMTAYKPYYESWAGDQGTFIGGLYDYYQVNKDPYCMSMISRILTGVKMKMTMPFTNNNGVNYNAIYSWSGGKDPVIGPEGPLRNDPADYCSGLGVFMRYLYYCCQDTNIRNSIVNDPAYLGLIRQTADASYDDAYPKVNQEVPMFRQFNRLASLLAALRILTS